MFVVFIFLFLPFKVNAKTNPLENSNNKFGIHVLSENDFKSAADLVNSSGGDWGYVTFVITREERDTNRWQRAFDQARRLHLIPIVRVASKYNGSVWEAPDIQDINNWVRFFDSLNWVIENRYVVIGNEPNHASEWGGKINPSEYAGYLEEFTNKLHQSSSDYFVLPAGFDASAKNTKDSMDEALFIKNMIKSKPEVFNELDGWTSHSYPNPDFAGKVTDGGRGSIQTYKWELSFLQSLGVSKTLPVFITETGWSNQKVDPNQISEMYKYAFDNVWDDGQIVAVTPFILNYSNPPFSEFSWIKADGSTYPYYTAYKSIKKSTGTPKQKNSGQIVGALIQPVVFSKSGFLGIVLAKNTGQTIWDRKNTFIASDNYSRGIQTSIFLTTEPGRTNLSVFSSSTEQTKGVFIQSVYLTNLKKERITNSFPIEGLIVQPSKMQLGSFFARISGSLQSLFTTSKYSKQI